MQAGEGATGPAKSEDPKKYSCDWSSCKKEHLVDLNSKYPRSGKVEKGGYRDAWMSASGGLSPFSGNFPRLRLLPDGKPHSNQKTYDYQAHHLVPSTVLKNTGTLKANLKLIGYLVDHRNNGLIAPKMEEDQPLHRLPAHRGNHPAAYYDPIRNLISNLEKFVDGICKNDTTGDLLPQSNVIKAIDAISRKAEGMILAIRTPGAPIWPLRSNSAAEFAAAEADYQVRLAKYHATQSSQP